LLWIFFSTASISCGPSFPSLCDEQIPHFSIFHLITCDTFVFFGSTGVFFPFFLFPCGAVSWFFFPLPPRAYLPFLSLPTTGFTGSDEVNLLFSHGRNLVFFLGTTFLPLKRTMPTVPSPLLPPFLLPRDGLSPCSPFLSRANVLLFSTLSCSFFSHARLLSSPFPFERCSLLYFLLVGFKCIVFLLFFRFFFPMYTKGGVRFSLSRPPPSLQVDQKHGFFSQLCKRFFSFFL